MGRWFLGFGPAVGDNLESQQSSMMHWVFGYAWELDTALLKLEAEGIEGMNGSDARIGGAGIGYTHLFSMTNHSPIVSADVIWGSAKTDHATKSYDIYGYDISDNGRNEKSGFALGLGVGYLFYRTSDINLETSLIYTQFLGDINGKSPGSLATRLALYF